MRNPLKQEVQDNIYRSPIFHPLVLLGIWMGVGCLFALQEYAELRFSPNHMSLSNTMTLWTIYSSVCGIAFVLVWICLRSAILTSGWGFLLKVMLPLSIAVSVVEEVVFVSIFPYFVAPVVYRSYWNRLEMVLSGYCVTNVAFFWIALLIVRGVGYYERLRLTEVAASELQAELVGAQLRALRMQLNPHFLFNTMNGVSSLIHDDPEAADRMLEQLSRLLRMTLDRGEVQEVTLRDEIDYVQLYLEIQRTRFGKRLRYEFAVAPETLDAMIPTMILQPIVENAYRHGISTSLVGGLIRVSASTEGVKMVLSVTNTTLGVKRPLRDDPDRVPVGVSNVTTRLELHYKDRQSFTLSQIDPETTEARLTFPLKIYEGGDSQGFQGLVA